MESSAGLWRVLQDCGESRAHMLIHERHRCAVYPMYASHHHRNEFPILRAKSGLQSLTEVGRSVDVLPKTEEKAHF